MRCRMYCELTVEAQRLVDLEDEKLCNTTETLLVEPHYLTLACSTVTPELMAQGRYMFTL